MPLTIEYRPIVLPPESRTDPARVEPAPVVAPRRAWPGPPLRGTMAGFSALGAIALAVALANGLPASEARASAPKLQPFETPGLNFPGSAFYFLEQGSGIVAPAATGDGLSGASGPDRILPQPLDAGLGDSIARPTFLAGSAEDRFRALHCLTSAIYYEAATEPDAGQRAVAQVVLNRVAHPQWPNSVCGVVYQGSERPGCQFSFACDGSMARAPARSWWLRARAVAERALAGEVYAPVGLATYYHTGAVNPPWAAHQVYIGAIGAHLFYRPPGASGRAVAFTDRYFGGEPTPGPRQPVASSPPVVTPAGSGPAYAPGPGPMLPEQLPPLTSATPLPALPAPNALPVSGRIREEYRNSGRWIAQPKG